MIRLQRTDFLFRSKLDDVVELVAADVARFLYAERFEKKGGRIGGFLARGREVELDQIADARSREQSAARVEPRRLLGTQQLLLPQRVGAGQRGMTAEIDLHGGREPAKRPAVGARQKKRRFGEIHLRADVLHPFRRPLAIEQTDSRGISAERLIGERVNLEKA